MILIILLLVSISYSPVLCLFRANNFNVSGICGFPGEPLSAQHNIENQSVFSSGHTINYQCVNSLGYKQDRTCFNGQWSGSQARCGFTKDNDIKRVVITNCLKDRVIFDFNDLNLKKDFDPFANSFSADRYEERPIRVSNSTCLRWHLHLKNKSYFQFVRTDFATVFEGVSKSNKEVPVVTAFVAKKGTSNLCQIEAMKRYKHIFTNKWINYGYKYHFYISCQKTKSTESQNVLIIETVTKLPLTLDLIRFYVAEGYGSASDPACGVPEMPVGVIATAIKEYQLYELYCDEPYFTNTTRVVRTQMICTSNGFWSGSYAECKPRMSCTDSQTFKPDSSAQIKSIENVFYYNKTLWFAINGTVINYQCVGQGSDSLNIKSKKCSINGLWDRMEPMCNQIDEYNEDTVKPVQSSREEPLRKSIEISHLLPIYGMAAFTSLIVIIIAITTLILIWKRNKRREYNDPNEGSPAQNGNKFCNDGEVVGSTHRLLNENSCIDENQSIFRKPYQYQNEAIYDVPQNNSKAVPLINTKGTELEDEPIYDRPKQRHLNPYQ